MMGQPGLRFAYRLGAHLGCPNVPAMLRSMSSTQLLEWEAFYEAEPFGNEIENHRAGMICSTIANASRSKKTDKWFRPTDFFPLHGRPRDPSAASKSRAAMQALAQRSKKGRK